MKYEMKIEFSDKSQLKTLFDKCYFEDNNGRLKNKENHLLINKTDPIYIMLKGLNNMTVRITNTQIIDGCSRFVIDESDTEVCRLFPCSIYCIIDDGKYSFY
jgi:hypothetical protein